MNPETESILPDAWECPIHEVFGHPTKSRDGEYGVVFYHRGRPLYYARDRRWSAAQVCEFSRTCQRNKWRTP